MIQAPKHLKRRLLNHKKNCVTQCYVVIGEKQSSSWHSTYKIQPKFSSKLHRFRNAYVAEKSPQFSSELRFPLKEENARRIVSQNYQCTRLSIIHQVGVSSNQPTSLHDVPKANIKRKQNLYPSFKSWDFQSYVTKGRMMLHQNNWPLCFQISSHHISFHVQPQILHRLPCWGVSWASSISSWERLRAKPLNNSCGSVDVRRQGSQNWNFTMIWC